MKKLLLTTIAILGLLSAHAQTNVVSASQTNIVNLITNAPAESKSEAWSVEVTFGGGGIEVDGVSETAVDFSVSVNPFESLPNLWFGVVQSAAWDPKFYGSTDVNANYSWHLYKSLYLNTGWSGGVVYDSDDTTENIWRTGPEATFQYYLGEEERAFIYAGVNYDIIVNHDKSLAENGFRYSWGLGWTF
jgi:hypothetical protein